MIYPGKILQNWIWCSELWSATKKRKTNC